MQVTKRPVMTMNSFQLLLHWMEDKSRLTGIKMILVIKDFSDAQEIGLEEFAFPKGGCVMEKRIARWERMKTIVLLTLVPPLPVWIPIFRQGRPKLQRYPPYRHPPDLQIRANALQPNFTAPV